MIANTKGMKLVLKFGREAGGEGGGVARSMSVNKSITSARARDGIERRENSLG